MKGFIVVLMVLLGIVSWNSANFVEYDPYGLFCALVFTADCVMGWVLLISGALED